MIAKRLVQAFGITAAAAGLATLIAPPKWVFFVWILTFLMIVVVLAVGTRWHVYTLRTGYTQILDFLTEIISRGRNEDVFVFAAYNVADELLNHPYLLRTERMLADGAFDRYRRVVVLRTSGDADTCVHLVKRFGDSPRFMLATQRPGGSLPLNLLTISPSTVVLGFPKGAEDTKPDADILTIGIRSRVVYTGIRALVEAIWKSSNVVKDAVVMDPVHISSVLAELQKSKSAEVEDENHISQDAKR